jgi:UDP-N-acetylmuramate dehydrogenase
MTALAEFTTLRVGGPAERLLRVSSTEELIDTVLAVWADGDEWLVLGGGSNLLVADDGFEGTVIKVETRGIRRLEAAPGRARIRVEAGEDWDALVAHTLEQGWAGLEPLSGIPGSTGASPVQNIGAYGAEVSASLVAIDFLDYDTGERMLLTAVDLELGYRTSALKRGRRGVVLAVEFDLADTGGLSTPIAYPQLATALGVSLGATVPLEDVRNAVLGLRSRKGMVLDPDDPDSVSAGSFFTNPIVPEAETRALPDDAPRWPVDPEPADLVLPLGEVPAPRVLPDPRVKLSAAWLIERAGIGRGFALPGSRAAISSKHTLALTNRGGASAAEIAELARFVQIRVFSEFGVHLEPEPNLVGLSL